MGKAIARGFTLVELLVVIAIIGVLVALLLPAVQAARESSRRSQCLNRMKQLCLAVQQFHDAKNGTPIGSSYPYDATSPNAPKVTRGRNIMWTAEILPYMERQNLYALFEFDKRLYSTPRNRDAAKTVVVDFICPSDPESEQPILDRRGDAVPGAGGPQVNPSLVMGLWYPASIGPTSPDGCDFCSNRAVCCQGFSFGTQTLAGVGDSSVGMFTRFPRRYRFAEVSDGLSRTVMLGETLPGHNIFNGAFNLNFPVASMSVPLNKMIDDEGKFVGNFWPYTGGFKSLHPGGANLGMGDASVQFVRDSIDERVYAALGTRAGGETEGLELQ